MKLLKLILPIFLLIGCVSKSLVQYQIDADIYRLRHLEKHLSLIQEYHNKSGKYPFEGKTEKTVKVSFVTEEQRTGLELAQSETVMSIDQEDYRAELERVLGRSIRLWFDPQKVATTAPNHYLYVFEKGYYYFVVHLNQEYPFAAILQKGFSILEVTNDPIQQDGFRRFNELLKDQSYLHARSRIPAKRGWFDKLESENK